MLVGTGISWDRKRHQQFQQKPIQSFKNHHNTIILLMEEIMHQLRFVVNPMIYTLSYIPGSAGFLPSTVSASYFTSHIGENDLSMMGVADVIHP